MAAARPPARLSRSLRACTAEGLTAEVVMACATGSVTTAWALHLGCSIHLIGLLGALPFLAQLLQAPGAWLTSRFGARRVALTTVALSRQAFLPLVALPWLRVDAGDARTLLIACCGAHHGLGILCNNAWVTWAGELVPTRVRGRYFGRRTAICTVASAASTLVVGSVLDHGDAVRVSGVSLAGVTAAGCVAGAVSVALMAQQRGGHARALRWRPALALRPFSDPKAVRLGAYLATWNAAVGFSAPFFGLYVLRDLAAGFRLLAVYSASSSAARTLTASSWGRLVDRVGARRVLVATTAGLAVAPAAWLLAPRCGTWALLAEAVAGGALLAGHGVASFTLPMQLAPAEERPHYHAAFATTGGAAFAIAAACGAALAEGAPALRVHLSPLQLTLAVSMLVRCAAAAVSLGIVGAESGGHPRPQWTAARRDVRRAAAGVLARSFAARRGLRKKREAALAASSARARGPGEIRRSPRGAPSGGRSRAPAERIDYGEKQEVRSFGELQAGESGRIRFDGLR